MPSKTQKQARMMAAACRGNVKPGSPSSKVPQSVACEFHEADKKTGILRKRVRTAMRRHKLREYFNKGA